LQTPFPRALLAADITLRLFPTTHPGIPPIRGGVLGYLAAARMLQMVVSGMIVDTRNARIRVLSERLIKDKGSSIESGNESSSSGVPSRYILKWCTCDVSESSGGANNGNSGAPPEDPVTYVNRIQHIVLPRGTPASAYYPTLFRSAAVSPVASVATTTQSTSHHNNSGHNNNYYNDNDDDGSLHKNLQKLEFLDSTTTEGNVLFGIFEFEFTENCDKIRVHTIQNVEILNEGVFGQEGGAVPSSC
jgi:hypothetical protein